MHYSVIIPVYNKETHVARAIQSVLGQSHSQWELILVNDASTDQSLSIMKKFKDPRITIIERENPGPGGYKARNAGVRAAAYDWLAFLDADDEWDPEYLSVIADLHAQFPQARLLSTGWQNLYAGAISNPDQYFQKYAKQGNHTYDRKHYIRASLQSARPICSSVATVNKELFLKAGMFPEQSPGRGGDVDTWFRLLMTDAVAGWAAYRGATYHRNSDNMTTQNILPRLRGNHLLRSIRTCLRTQKDSAVRSLLKQYRCAVYRSTAKGQLEVCFLRVTRALLGAKISRRMIEQLMRIKRKVNSEKYSDE